MREASYRFRATFRRRWAGYLTLIVLIGLLGGVAMAAVAGARRTQSSFPTYLASTNPSDTQMFTEFVPVTGKGYSQKVAAAVARVPHVERAVTVVGFDGTLQVLGQRPSEVPGEAPPSLEGSTGNDAEYLSTDRVTVLEGRMADPARQDEVVMSAGAAAEYGLHIGSTLRVAFFTDAQASQPTFSGYPRDKPHLIVPFKLVGIVEWSPQVVQDDDAALGNQIAVITPALTRRLETCCAYYSYVSFHLDGGLAHEAAVVSAVNKVIPNLGPEGGASTNAPYVAKAERAIRPEAIALGVFGLIAALAALVINGQVISRLVRRNAEEAAIVRALGAGPAMAMADGLVGVLGATAAGSVLAVGVAVALSPLAPIGPVRPVYPAIGVSFDWTVLGFGFLLFVVALTVAALVVAFRVAPHRLAGKAARTARDPAWHRAALAVGLPPSAMLGIRSALSSRSGRDAAPVRSALLGAVVAVTVIVTSLTFASSLNALVSQPPLYGWNWNYALLSGFSAAENLPAAETAALLDHDPDVAHWAGAYFESVTLDGQSGVSVLAMSPGAAVSPSMLSGHAPDEPSQVVLGPATLASLHAHVGDRVVAEVDGHTKISLRVVGTATLPTIGGSGDPSLEMGTGAVMASSLFSASDLNQQGAPVAGPMAVFIALRPGVSQATALRSLDHITAVLNRSSDPDAPIGGVVSALRPAEIADSHSIIATPALLAVVLAIGAIGALGLTLISSVRQRRRQFALLKALGFTQGQIAASVAWQSSVAAVVGVVLGVPIGIALGRWLWTLFADGISAVPHPTVPTLSIAAVALGAVVFANLVAVFPGRVAARTRTSLLLRTE
jgi:predicted lysophospholipase L1 biosynthesis ABC-type transport system permease subunit